MDTIHSHFSQLLTSSFFTWHQGNRAEGRRLSMRICRILYDLWPQVYWHIWHLCERQLATSDCSNKIFTRIICSKSIVVWGVLDSFKYLTTNHNSHQDTTPVCEHVVYHCVHLQLQWLTGQICFLFNFSWSIKHCIRNTLIWYNQNKTVEC